MSEKRPFALTIAGLDPSGGAGLLADIKTMELHKVHGIAICTGITLQTENVFYEMHWTPIDLVLRSIEVMLKSYPVKAIKIGIIPSLDYLLQITTAIREQQPHVPIIWDTVLKSSSQFGFTSITDKNKIARILQQVDLITPNYEEINQLGTGKSPEGIALKLRGLCNVLLKGGHNPIVPGHDFLYTQNEIHPIHPIHKSVIPKHGSGCVLAAAIASQIAFGQPWEAACRQAKLYVENYLNSNTTLIGHHYVS